MINEALQTLIVVTVAISAVFAIGYPMATFAVKHLQISCTSEQLWTAAPLVGAGAIILICQNLLYLNVRIPYSAILLWGGIGLVTMASIVRARFSFSDIPWKLIVTGVAIYAVHGSGLLSSGVSNYYGYGWVDMYNYVSQAQFFIDFPFSSTIDTHEHLRVAQYYKHDRIGQSVLHAFIAASSGADAQQTFGATILLSPMLIFFSLFLLSTSLGIELRFAYPAAIVASLSPAVASAHLECFFSQAMAMPFIFLWPLVVSRLRSHPGVRSIFLAGLLFAVTATVYTEVMLPLVLIFGLVLLLTYWLKGDSSPSQSQIAQVQRSWQGLLLTFFLIGLPLVVGLLANIGFYKGLVIILKRTTGSGVLDGIYPWAFKLEGLARLWIGHKSNLSSGWISYALVAASVLVIIVAIAYAVSLYRRSLAPSQLFSILLACIPLAPLMLSVVTANRYPYQFYKLLLIVWPLILFFATCGIAVWMSRFRQKHSFIYFQTVMVCLSLGVTSRIAVASSIPEAVANATRGGVHLLIDDNFKKMRTALDRLESKKIYIWWYDKALYHGNWRSRWLAYYARKNEVWTMNPVPPSGSGVGTPEPLQITANGAPAIGISWRDVPVGVHEKIGSFLAGTDPFWLYSLSQEDEIRRLDEASTRTVISRSMQLEIDENADAGTWYPLWVAGQVGSATLITANFAKSRVVFRYDQWGYRDLLLEPGGECSGKALRVNVRLNAILRKIDINCNGAVAEAKYADATPSLSQTDRLGFNSITSTLGGTVPLAKIFPGKIVEQQ